jgi:type II restriction enzyme
MKLGFEEQQAPFDSPSQSARVWTERWIRDWAFCPNCGNSKLAQFESNRPVADFSCSSCNEEYELKSKKGKFGSRVVDGSFRTKCERLEANNNPNLFLLNYDLASLRVANLIVVPRLFFVRDIIQERKPLAPTARRAGWIGSNILLDRIPVSGRIPIVENGSIRSREEVLGQWKKTLFLRDAGLDERGWFLEVMKCVEEIGAHEFRIDDVYAFESRLRERYPQNQHVREKIRQQLQKLRDRGYLEFVSRGNYRLLRG